DTISLPYQVDSKDKFAVFPAGKTMTGYVVQTRKPLLATENIIRNLAFTGQIEIVGTPAKVWLGVPLIVSEEVIGVIAVQSYSDPEQYTCRELELLKFVADQIAIVISRKGVEESFQKEKAYLDQLFEGSPEAIIMIDIHGKVTKINSEFTHLFGFTEQEIVGENIDNIITTPEYFKEASGITSGAMQNQVVSVETKRKHKDGRLIDVSLLVTPIVINDQIVGGYGIYRDITDRKRIEMNLIAAKEKAEESDKLKSAFLSNMSHEIRTPMNAILGFSTLLSDPGVSEEEKAEFVHIIRDRGNDLLRIIDDIIDVAKIESGQIKIDIKECQVNLLLANLLVTLNEVKRKTAKTNIALHCLPANNDNDFTILTDGNRLRQIMTNLIENSLKFTHEGFVEFGYSLKNIGESSYIEFFVHDTGIGIPSEMHEVIFERFRQVDNTNTRKYGGTGLGLTISKNLIKLLGGEIRLTSENDKGTTFHILLPLQIPASKMDTSEKSATLVAPPHNWSKKVILIVEDEDSNFFLMDRILRRTGASLIWAKNGMDAIEICKNQAIDIILMDIRMPVMDGYEVTQIIKKDHPDITIIAQTAYALKGEREKSLAAGCDNYIAKPIDSKELMAILHKYLDY
ncbi:MAG: ATP-binding protein, partial [Bacteroidota bacterium]